MTTTTKPQAEFSALAQHLHGLARDRRVSIDYALQAELAEKIPCGFASDPKRGPAQILVPKDLRVMPCRYIHDLQDIKNRDAYGYSEKKVGVEVKIRSTTEDMNDHDFTISHVFAGAMMHSASHQPVAVANQPDWVTYAMNSQHLPRLYRLCPQRIAEARTAFDDWSDPFATVEFLIEGFRGGIDWWWENADLLLRHPRLSFTSRAGIRILEKAQQLIDTPPHMSAETASDLVYKVVPKGLNTSNDSRLSSACRILGVLLKDHEIPEKLQAALEKGKGHVVTPLTARLIEWLFTQKDVQLIIPKTAGFSQNWNDVRVSTHSSACRSAAKRFSDGLALLADSGEAPTEDINALRDWIKSKARDVIMKKFDEVQTPEAAEGLALIAEAVMTLTEDLGEAVTYSGGVLQREEARRMARAGWPHISNKHPDERKPQMHEIFGSFTVYGLKTSAKDRFELPLHRIGMLCDDSGCYLPYAQAVGVLEAEFDDFAEGSDWGDCHGDFIPGITYALEQKGLDPNRVHDVEADEDRWFPQLGDAGIEDANRLHVELGVGPEQWTAVRLPWYNTQSELQAHVFSTAAAFIYNSYSDYAKQCWLVHRGMISREDEISVKEWDPAKDLSPAMLQDFIAFCRYVPEVDGPWGELSTYDGAGDMYIYSGEGDLACSIVLYRSN